MLNHPAAGNAAFAPRVGNRTRMARPARDGTLADRARMTRHCLMLTVVSLMVLAGCATRAPLAQPRPSAGKSAGPRLSESEAITIAKGAAERFGVKLSEHAEPRATYRPTDVGVVWPLIAEGPGEPAFGDHVWVVHFGSGPKTNYPGGDFMVYVDDKTGRSRLVGGM